MASGVKFEDYSQEAKNGMLDQEYQAMRAAGSELLEKVRDEAKKVWAEVDAKNKEFAARTNKGKKKGEKVKKKSHGKAAIYNKAVWTKKLTKYGYCIVQIGMKDAIKARGNERAKAEYAEEIQTDKDMQYGTSITRENSYLKRTVMNNIGSFRNKLAEYLPNVQRVKSSADEEETIE